MEKIRFMTSLLTFYLKGEIAVEQNFLKLRRPNTILSLIPLGCRKYNIPINQISSVGTNFHLLVKNFLVGIIEIIGGFILMSMSPAAILLVILGFFTFINSFQTELEISTTAGHEYTLFFLIFEKKKALAAEQMINGMIGFRMNDTNVRIQTENQTAALNSAQSANTQAIINAINSNNQNKKKSGEFRFSAFLYHSPRTQINERGAFLLKATPHNYRLAPLSFTRLIFFRRNIQNSLEIHQVTSKNLV